MYYRFENNRTLIFRSTDFDKFNYIVNGINGVSEINCTTFSGSEFLNIQLIPRDSVASKEFGQSIYIPTKYGFSNTPGCRETYTAYAIVKHAVLNISSMEYETIRTSYFPLTALEYGMKWLFSFYVTYIFFKF